MTKRETKREYVKEIKKTVGCKKCGKESPPETLHFHHIDGETKVNDVSNMVRLSYSLEELKNEIRKCEVLCSECHTAHHSHSKQDCIDAIREVAEKLGKSPSWREYIEHKEDNHPSDFTIRNRFGSWNNGKEAAGLSVFEHGSGKAASPATERQASFNQFDE